LHLFISLVASSLNLSQLLFDNVVSSFVVVVSGVDIAVGVDCNTPLLLYC